MKRLGELFDLAYDLLLYDVTSTYFEGLAARNPLAQRGHSRDHRPDCEQVCIALVVSREGMPLGYEVFPGNRTDVTTVEEIVETMEARYGIADRVWVMDRGMMSAENVAWLQETGRRYLLGTAKSELKHWAREISEEGDWQRVRESVEVKLGPGPQGQAWGSRPPRSSTAIFSESVLSLLALPPWMAFMASAWPSTKGMPSFAQRSASQYQVKVHSAAATRPSR